MESISLFPLQTWPLYSDLVTHITNWLCKDSGKQGFGFPIPLRTLEYLSKIETEWLAYSNSHSLGCVIQSTDCPVILLSSDYAAILWSLLGSHHDSSQCCRRGRALESRSGGQFSTGESIRTWHSKTATSGTCSTMQQNANPFLVFSSFS